MKRYLLIGISIIFASFIFVPFLSAAPVYQLKMNVIYPPPSTDWEAKHLTTKVFAKRVEEATNGQVKIQFFFNSQLSPVLRG